MSNGDVPVGKWLIGVLAVVVAAIASTWVHGQNETKDKVLLLEYRMNSIERGVSEARDAALQTKAILEAQEARRK